MASIDDGRSSFTKKLLTNIRMVLYWSKELKKAIVKNMKRLMDNQMDPYVYKGTNILINKLNIRNEQELIAIETQFFIANVLDIPSAFHKIDFSSHGSVQQIHQLLF